MISKSETERSLKRFLKKKVTFTIGFLIGFLITGAVGYASSEALASQAELTKEELLSKIAMQKEEIQAQIDGNNQRLKELDKDNLNILRKGDYYSKPIYPSTQVFFSYNYIDSGKMKNRTREAWSDTIDIVKKNIEYKLENGGDPSSISGITAEDIAKYQTGQMSLDDVAYNALYSTTGGAGLGIVTDGAPHTAQVDIGVKVDPLSPEIPSIDREVQVSIKVPGVPNVTVQAPTLTPPTLTVPTIGAITLTAPSVPTVNLSVETPTAVAPITVAAANPAAPSAVSINAPTVSVSVTPPNIVPNTPTAPVTPGEPESLTIAVTPTGPGTFVAPNPPTTVAPPLAPTEPTIVLFNPSDIVFSGTGFGQPGGANFNVWGALVAQNFQEYDTEGGTLNITVAGGTTWTGDMKTIRTDTNTSNSVGNMVGTYHLNTVLPGQSTGSSVTFISHVEDVNVLVKGTYNLTATSGGNTTKMFASINPYLTGLFTASDKTFELASGAVLNLSSTYAPGSTSCVVGFEHQLLAHGPSGGDNYANVYAGTTHILKNSGTINITSGANIVGMMIDTEYGGLTAATAAFSTPPKTINAGTININSGAKNCIGIDYGMYLLGAGGLGPNTIVSLGNINVDGSENYGFRMRRYVDNSHIYYDLIEATGDNGKITVSGSKNVGISVSQGKSTGDPIQNIHDLNITVSGNNNVGFYRNPNAAGANANTMNINSSTIGTGYGGVVFGSAGTNSTLFRSDYNEIKLNTLLNLTTGSTGNSAMQAGSNIINGVNVYGTVTNASTITASLPTFYALTAGNFSGSLGATANNNGTLSLSGTNSIGIAIAAGNTGNNTGNITVSGANSTGIFNLGTTAVTGGTITASGANGVGIFNNGSSASVSTTNIVANAAKAVGIFNSANKTLSLTGGTVKATGTSGNLATGIYNDGGSKLNPNGTAVTANANAVGVYNKGTMNFTGGSITASGANSIGAYSNAGTMTLPTPINASGANATGVVNEGGSISNIGSITVNASGAGSVGLYNKSTAALTATPILSLSGAGSTGIYNAAGATVTATGNITGASGTTGVAGIYNAGTLTDSTGAITIDGGSSTGIYNDGSITDVSGSIGIKGASGAISIGVINNASKTVDDITGGITAHDYATAIYNAGTMKVSGSVTASGTADSTGIYNTGAGTLTLNGSILITVSGNSATGIYNDSSNALSLNAGAVSVTGHNSAGIYQAGGTFNFSGTATINTTGREDAGVYTSTSGGLFKMTGGTIKATGSTIVHPVTLELCGSVGIYNQQLTTVEASGGTITALNTKSTGVYNEGIFKNSGTTISTTGSKTTGLYNNGTSATATITGGSITTTGVEASAVYNKSGTVNFNGNNTIKANDGATGMYVSAGTVTTGGGAITTINVNNTLGSGEGVGVFASDDGTTGSTVDLTGSKIIVVGGSSAVASYGAGAGAGESDLDLHGATVDYSGEGFAVYSNGQYGKIDMTNAQLHLRGKAYGVQMDYSSGTSPITFSSTTIDVWDPTVTLASLKDYPTPLNVSTMATSGIAGALGTGVTVNDHTLGTYKLAMIDGGVINIDENIDKSLGAGTHSYDYFKRFQSVRMDTTVNSGVEAKAVLTTAKATTDYNNQVIGIEASSSSNATSASETKVTMLGGSKITAARTDSPSGETGGVGVFVNYGEVSVGSGAAINVQQGYDSINKGVGVYAVNGSTVTNDGDINVAGKQAIGVLGMGYRELGGASQGAEWGASALNQGELHVTNNSKITLDGDSSIGMYAKNNTAGTVPNTDIELSNTSTGEVTVGNGTSSSDMAIGMYGDNATIKNSGKITTGDYGVGIYGTNGSIISGADTTDLGTITIGGNSVGIMGTGSTLASTVTGVDLVSTNTTDDKVGIMYDGAPSDIDFDIDGTNFAKGTVIYLKDPGATTFTYGTSAKTIKVGNTGVGIYINDAAGTGTAENKGTIDLLATSDNAVGMYTAGGTIKNSGTIGINGTTGQVGMFASGALATADNTAGTIDLNVDNGTGIYIDDGATLVDPGTVNFVAGTKQGIGILLNGANMTVSAAGLAITSDNDNQNILIYAQDKAGVASNVTNNGTITIDGVVLPPSGSNKTVGVYLKDTAAQNTYQNGTIDVTNGAIGIYSSGDNIIQNATINSTKTAVAGTVGIYIDGNSTLDTMTVNAQGAATGESVIGVYAKTGVVNVLGGLNLTTGTGADYGTGMYLTGGATVAGTPISITNNSSVTNVGLYYTGTGIVAHGTDISLNGNNLVGIYADEGITINNPMAISYNAAGTKFIGAYVTADSKYNSSSATDDVITPNSAAILVGKGTAVNTGTLTVSDGTSVTMASLAQGAADTAMSDNQGIINVNAGAGMLAGELTGYAGTSETKNSGTINVAAGGIGVAVKGTNGHFDGASGTINVAPSAPGATAAGIYLEETAAGQVTSIGTLNIGDQGVGIYANKSTVNFPVTLGASSNGGVGVFATGVPGKPTTISGTIDAGASQDTVGVYVNDENVAFNNATVTSGAVGTGTPIGVYLNNAIGNYSVSGVTINANSAQSIGLYAGATTTELANTVNVTNGGLGVVVPAGSTLNTNNAVLNIDGIASIGIVLDGGTGNLGTTGALAINFTNGGIAVFVRNSGVMNIGSMLTVTGAGTLAAAENASLSNSGTLNVNGSTALFGSYTSAGPGPYTLSNTSSGVINVIGGGVGIAAVNGSPASTASVTVINDGLVTVTGKNSSGDSSIGLYTDLAEIQNNGTIDVNADGIGIYANNSNNTVTNNDIKLNGSNATGIMISGTVGSINNTSITGTVDGTVGMYLDSATGSINAGNITLLNDSVGIAASGATNATVDGNVIVGDSSANSAVGLYAYNGANVTIGTGLSITGGSSAIAVAAKDAGTVINGVDTTNIALGTSGVYIYAGNGGTVGVVGSGTLAVNDNVGVMIENSGSITGITSIDVSNGGLGAYFIGASSPIPTINVNGGSASKYSIGAFYSQMPAGVAITLPTINQNGDYTIGAVIDEGITASMGNIELTNAGAKNQVGVMAKGTLANPVTLTTGTVKTVGDENLGIYGEYADITSGAVTTDPSSDSTDKSTASIGIYTKKGSTNAASITAGANTIGVYADTVNANGVTAGNITVGENAIGAYATGTGSETVTVNGDMSVANNTSVGVYTKDAGINVTAPTSVTVGSGTSAAVINEGLGDITYSADTTVADKGTSTGSMAIYKKGSGNIVSSGNWTVGNGGYGMYLIGDGGTITATNNANMTLKEAAVGIYGEGSSNIVNNGDITVGTTYLGLDALSGTNPTHTPQDDTRNSVGIYARQGANAVNTGTITVDHDHSVAAYVYSGDTGSEVATSIDNQGTINVDNGAIAMMARGKYAQAINSGTINMGNTLAPCGAQTIGMAAYDFATLVNIGTINTNEGVGMYVATNATLDNQGIINVKNGTGIQTFGSGTIINEGTINMDVTGTGIAKDTLGSGPAVDLSVKIDENGDITIGGKYITIGGTFTANAPIVLNGPFVDITHFDTAVPLFSAPDVSGTIHLTPNFALLENGYSYEIEDFTKALGAAGAAGKLTVQTSPLFITKESGGSLFVAKKPYEDMVLRDPNAPIDGVKDATGDYTERQFVELYRGLDSLLYKVEAGEADTKDSLILKQLNTYLENVYATTGSAEAFNNETARTMAEARGDIYSTIQTRMQNVQNAFDTSFDELLDSYNISKDSGKYSVMYTNGKYKDDTIGIDKYDYNIAGLLYMKEKEGRDYGNKHGYTLGFAVSRFDFDDAPVTGKDSKENVYSLRAGVHNVHNFSDYDSFRLVSKLELGYNRHEAKRSLELGDQTGIKNYRNKGKYNTYNVTLDNRFEKTLYRSLSAKVDIYGGVDLEYGAIGDFSEKGDGLELKVKGNDYFSVQPNVGINAEKRVYLGKKLSMKVFGDVNYAYELGENYNSNKAKIKNGTEGYYKLIRPEKEEGILAGRAGVTLEKANKVGITLDAEARDHQNKQDTDMRYNLRLKYVF